LRTLPAVEKVVNALEEDEKIGANIVRRSLEEPIRQIARNAGVEGAIVAEQVKANKSVNYGYNAQADEYEDMVKAGVLDPTKVVRLAVQNSSSIAGLMLTTEALISDL